MKKHTIISKKIATTACALFMTISLVGCNNVSTIDMDDVVFEDQEFVYDGTVKTLEIKNLPNSVEYTFSIINELGNEIRADEVYLVGAYTFTANFVPNSSYVTPDPLTATLTIVQGTYDMSNFAFRGTEIYFDGQAHLPTVSGIPSGVTSTVKLFDLDNNELINGATYPGIYRVTASFSGDVNYKSISNKETFMVIRQADYNTSGIEITDLSYIYDGKAHLPTVSGLPDGVTASFTIYKDGESSPVSSATDVGLYHIVVSFAGDNNHNPIASRTVDLVIDKAVYNMNNFQINDLTRKYTGQPLNPTVKGLPNGVTASFKYYLGQSSTALDSAVDSGTYKVVVSFKGDSNHEPIADKEYQFVIETSVYDMTDFNVTGLEVNYDGQAHFPVLNGVPTGVTASYKIYSDEVEVDGATEIGIYKVVVSFSVDEDNYAPIQNREYKLTVSKGSYDMSSFKFENLEHNYDGLAHTASVSGLPEGVSASIKLFKVGSEIALDEATEAGIYTAVASFTGDATKFEPIANKEASFIIAKAAKTIDVTAYSRTFNINDTAKREVEIDGDLQGSKPVFSYRDSEGNIIENINEAPVGEYDVDITFSHNNYVIGNILHSKLTITDKVVKNISTYAELQAMAKEAQENFTLYEADGVNELTGEVENWSEYNGGNPADRWANKVTYQLVTDINCRNQVWKAAGWDVGHYLLTEEAVVGGEDVRVIKGTDYVVNVPRADGPADYGFGYLSLFLDGNGHSIQNMVLANNTHENTVSPTNELGYYPSWCQDMGSDYRRTGMFVSTAFSTFKDIVFDNPTMTIDDTVGTVTWAGFINATESQGNTYQGLTFNHPVINANVKKANIGGIAGITLVLARDIGASGVRGADFYLDRPEEMVVNFKDVEMNKINFNVNCVGSRSSVGGLYGENQGGWLTFNLDNVDIAGDISLTGSCTNNNTADFFGLIEGKYMSKGNFTKDPDPFYQFNISNCDTNITYYLPESVNFGTGYEGDSYHTIEVSEQDYVAGKYYKLDQGTYNFSLATGNYDPDEYYYERAFEEVTLTQDTYVASKYYTRDIEGRYTLATGEFSESENYFENVKEKFDTSLLYIKVDSSMASILNEKVRITDSHCRSGIEVNDIKDAITFANASYDYDGSAKSLVATGVPANVVVNYENNGKTDAGEYVVIANFSVMTADGLRTLATFTKTAILTINAIEVDASAVLNLPDISNQYNGFYQEFTYKNAPSWVEVTKYDNNVRREIGTQEVTAYISNIDNPNFIIADNKLTATFTIEPYQYDLGSDTDTLIAVATEDKIQLTAKNLGTSGTAQVVYFRSYEYFVIDEESGVSTNQSYGTVIEGQVYNCGTLQTLIFDRFIPHGIDQLDLVYCKFALRTGTSESNYALLHNAVYCKDIHSEFGYDYNLRTTIKGIDYPPFQPTLGVQDAVEKDANYTTYNILLKDCIYPNEYVDENGDTQPYNSGDPTAIPHVVNGVTYYMKRGYFEDCIDPCVAMCKDKNIKLIGIFYNWNEVDQTLNPYYATYPDARDPGSMAQFALNTSNPFGEGYLIACLDFMMKRYTDATRHVFKDFIIGNELELCQRWYPIQTYQGNTPYSALKFAAEYSRTLRLANNTIKKYVPDGNAYAPFSRYMTPTKISKDSVYTIKSILTSINYFTKKEGDFDWGVTIHPYDHSHPFDIVLSASKKAEFNATFDSEGLTYTNIEVIDRYLKQNTFLYNGTNLRKVILDECGINNTTTNAKNRSYVLASLAFAYYRCASLDCIYALCMSTYAKYEMFPEAAALWKDIDKPGTFEMTADMFKVLQIFDRVNKVQLNAAEFLGADTWQEFMDVWQDPNVDWDALWNEGKIIQQPNNP